MAPWSVHGVTRHGAAFACVALSAMLVGLCPAAGSPSPHDLHRLDASAPRVGPMFIQQCPVLSRGQFTSGRSGLASPKGLPRISSVRLRKNGRQTPFAGILDFGKKMVDKIRGKKPEDPYKDRMDVLSSLQKLEEMSGEFGILVRGLEATGMLSDLAKAGPDEQQKRKKEPEQPPITLFAPTDSAFAQLPADCLLADCVKELDAPAENRNAALMDELKISLQGLLGIGRWTVSEWQGKSIAVAAQNGRKTILDLRTGSTVSDYEDYVLDMDLRQKVKVRNCVGVLSADLQCCNGVVHIVDRIVDGAKPLVMARPASESSLEALTGRQLEERGEQLQKELAEKRARLATLEGELAPIRELVAERKLSKPSVRELQETFERLSADLDNLKRRNEAQMAEAEDSATRNVLKLMLNVLDTFEMAERSITAETQGEKDIVATYHNVSDFLLQVLTSKGVTAVEALGEAFDPLLHEAVSRQESTEFGEGVNCMQYQRGYQVGSMLVRPALVVVSMGPGSAVPEAEGATEAVPESPSVDAPTDAGSAADAGGPAAAAAGVADGNVEAAAAEEEKAAGAVEEQEAAKEASLPEDGVTGAGKSEDGPAGQAKKGSETEGGKASEPQEKP